LLYTGDVRLKPSRTAERAEVPQCDFLITESTYGSPFWRFPDRAETEQRLVDLLVELIARGVTPVILAYSLGKAQESMSLLALAGMPCVVHPAVASIARIYERFGIVLGRWESWSIQGGLFDRSTRDLRGKVLIMPPHLKRDLRRVPRRKTIAVTGWALDSRRAGWTDYAFPISDHADFDELLQLVDRACPRIVYTTHGTTAFARELKRRGIAAESLRGKPQMRLF
jgi:Cft2 family RNA processing exonuclease